MTAFILNLAHFQLQLVTTRTTIGRRINEDLRTNSRVSRQSDERLEEIKDCSLCSARTHVVRAVVQLVAHDLQEEVLQLRSGHLVALLLQVRLRLRQERLRLKRGGKGGRTEETDRRVRREVERTQVAGDERVSDGLKSIGSLLPSHSIVYQGLGRKRRRRRFDLNANFLRVARFRLSLRLALFLARSRSFGHIRALRVFGRRLAERLLGRGFLRSDVLLRIARLVLLHTTHLKTGR